MSDLLCRAVIFPEALGKHVQLEETFATVNLSVSKPVCAGVIKIITDNT